MFPYEVWRMIFEYCDSGYLCSLARVSKYIGMIAEEVIKKSNVFIKIIKILYYKNHKSLYEEYRIISWSNYVRIKKHNAIYKEYKDRDNVKCVYIRRIIDKQLISLIYDIVHVSRNYLFFNASYSLFQKIGIDYIKDFDEPKIKYLDILDEYIYPHHVYNSYKSCWNNIPKDILDYVDHNCDAFHDLKDVGFKTNKYFPKKIVDPEIKINRNEILLWQKYMRLNNEKSLFN